MPARASTSTARRWPTGSARRQRCCARCVEALGRDVMAAEKLHADDTPVPVLAPGTGKTKTGRLWVYVRDDGPHAGKAPPAVLYRYSPDRKGEHPRAAPEGFRGFLQADGYAGFDGLYGRRQPHHRGGLLGACAPQVLRRARRPTARRSPREALERIGALYAIEADDPRPAARRAAARSGRRAPGRCSLSFEAWLETHLREALRQERARRRHPLCRSAAGPR